MTISAKRYIVQPFPSVKGKDEQKYGGYRTKRALLECYDAVAEAIKNDRPYETIFDPAPADLSIAQVGYEKME